MNPHRNITAKNIRIIFTSFHLWYLMHIHVQSTKSNFALEIPQSKLVTIFNILSFGAMSPISPGQNCLMDMTSLWPNFTYPSPGGQGKKNRMVLRTREWQYPTFPLRASKEGRSTQGHFLPTSLVNLLRSHIAQKHLSAVPQRVYSM